MPEQSSKLSGSANSTNEIQASENPCHVCDSGSADVAARQAHRLNAECFCLSLPEGALKRALKVELAAPEVFELIEQRCPHLFSAQPVFVSRSQQLMMAAVIQAIERVVALPAFRHRILRDAPAIVQHALGGQDAAKKAAQNTAKETSMSVDRQSLGSVAAAIKGVFFGYDFHLQGQKIGLIEVNTNAGGGMLNALLARSQHACCAVMDDIVHTVAKVEQFEQAIVAMFRHEWKLAQEARAHLANTQDADNATMLPQFVRPLATIAIVDEAPESQYLYPEFLLIQQLFERNGMKALIAAPEALRWQDGALWFEDQCIDLVYNRLTDFYLEHENARVLRQAYLADAVVLTPNPLTHALYADKRNLAIWSDQTQLDALGVDAETQACLLANIPRTEPVLAAHAERLWANRRHLFFKPNAGYGGRAAYRGDKLTKRVWEEILAGDYIAQEIVSPGERISGSPEMPAQMKFDIRQYTYEAEVQWTAARVYQGQTTNFRTPGGGFAPVYTIDDSDLFDNAVKLTQLLG